MTATRMWRLLAKAATIAAVGLLWILAASLLWRTRVPADLALPDLDPRDYFPDGELRRAERYERFFLLLWVVVTLAVLLALGVYASYGRRLARRVGLGRVGTGTLLTALAVTLVWAIEFPVTLAITWWERRHDLSSTPYEEVVAGAWISLFIEVTVVCFVMAVLMAAAARFRRWWWAVAAPGLTALVLAVVYVQPYLFFDTKPVRRAALAHDVRTLATAVGAEGTPVRIDEVHEDTRQANALALGIGPSSRVILWDTLLDGRFRRGEVRVVIAHEFAHIARQHLPKGVAWFGLITAPLLLAIALLTNRVGGLADPAVVPFALFLLIVLQLAIAPLGNSLSRRYEAEADWVALSTTRDAASARGLFKRFSSTGLGDPEPPGWSQVFLGTHPTLLDRIAMAEAWRVRARARAR